MWRGRLSKMRAQTLPQDAATLWKVANVVYGSPKHARGLNVFFGVSRLVKLPIRVAHSARLHASLRLHAILFEVLAQRAIASPPGAFNSGRIPLFFDVLLLKLRK